MKNFIAAAILTFVSFSAFSETTKIIGTYGIHLYFNETEFIDTVTFSVDESGSLKGLMHVPNDFDGEVTDIVEKEKSLDFDLFVPKNSSRPEDLIFHYQGTFFSNDKNQLIGYVTIKGESDFVASFVAFKRP